ncbi:MAG TPA: DUF2493 domain-containing protein [Thermomicrobiaceae bacterium]|nr:DUF2493 domain-containing protein [Thermomicrobiaceae bacterium]
MTTTAATRVIVAGSRGITDLNLVERAIQRSGLTVDEVVSGGARGVDQLGEQWARQHGLPVRRFPADWVRHGKAAGYRRNEEMAAYATHLVAIWDGMSRGTKHMIQTAKRRGLPVHVYTVTANAQSSPPSGGGSVSIKPTRQAPAPKRQTTTRQPARHPWRSTPTPLASYYDQQADEERLTWLDPRPGPPADWSGDYACPVCARSVIDDDTLSIDPYDIKDQAGVCHNDDCPHEGQPLVRLDTVQRGRSAGTVAPRYRQAALFRRLLSKALSPIKSALDEAKLVHDTVDGRCLTQLDDLLSWIDDHDIEPTGSKPEQLAQQHCAYVYRTSAATITDLQQAVLHHNLHCQCTLQDRIKASHPCPAPPPTPLWMSDKTAFHKRKAGKKSRATVTDVELQPVSGGSGEGSMVQGRRMPVRSIRQRRKDAEFGSARWFARNAEKVALLLHPERKWDLVERGERIHDERLWLKRSWAEKQLGYRSSRWG